MRIIWSSEANDDLNRLHAFLLPVAPEAAANVIVALTRGPSLLIDQPRMGARLEGFASREVRRIIVGKYEMRYEVLNDVIYILRIWHSREDRPFTDG